MAALISSLVAGLVRMAVKSTTETVDVEPTSTGLFRKLDSDGLARLEEADAAALERDGAKRARMYQDIQAEFRKTSPFVMLYQQTEVAAYRSNVDGLKIGPTSDSTYMFNVAKT